MNVKLTPHAAELLKAVRAQRQEPIEIILEHALEVLAHEHNVGAGETRSGQDQQQAVREMLDFIKRNRVALPVGPSVRDLIHEGHRV